MSLKKILTCGLVIGTTLAAGVAVAQDYPNRVVRFIVPYAAGGQPDRIARLLAPSLSSQLGQSFIVENLPGAGGIPAINAIQAAPSDGHVIMITDATHWAINPALRTRLSYDFLRDFIPVRQTHTTSLILAVSPTIGVNTTAELIALAKSKPGTLSYGSSGVGSTHHLVMEAMKHTHGLDILHVPYKSTSQTVPAVVGGQVQMTLTALASAAVFVKEGRLKLLAVSTGHRSPSVPDVPTFAESGGKPFDFATGGAIVVRTGTSRAIVNQLAAALDKAFATKDIIDRMNTQGIEFTVNSTPESLLVKIRGDIKQFSDAVRIAGVKPD